MIRVGRVKVTRIVNEEYHASGMVGYLNSHLNHYPFNKGFSAWFEKHIRYSEMEARLCAENRLPKINLKDIFSKDPAIKRRAIKAIGYRLPGRPFLMFVVLYFLRGGFLDGRAGLVFCLLRSFYEFMIDCKTYEIKRRNLSLPL